MTKELIMTTDLVPVNTRDDRLPAISRLIYLLLEREEDTIDFAVRLAASSIPPERLSQLAEKMLAEHQAFCDAQGYLPEDDAEIRADLKSLII